MGIVPTCNQRFPIKQEHIILLSVSIVMALLAFSDLMCRVGIFSVTRAPRNHSQGIQQVQVFTLPSAASETIGCNSLSASWLGMLGALDEGERCRA